MTKGSFKKNFSFKSIFNYLAVLFLLSLLYFIHLLVQNWNVPTNIVEQKKTESYYGFSQKLSRVQMFYKNQQYGLAIDLCEKLEQEGLDKKKNHSILLLKAACQKATGLYKTALSELDRADMIQASPFSHFLKGAIYEKLGDESSAIRAYEDAYKEDPFYAFSYEKLGDLYFRRGNYPEAVSAYEGRGNYRGQVSEINQIKLALVHLFAGSNAQAEWHTTKYLEATRNKKYLAYCYFVRAIARDRQAKTAGAEADFQNAMEITTLESKGLLSYYYGVFLLKNDRLSDSIDLLRPLVYAKRKEMGNAAGLLAQVHFRGGNFKESYQYFKKFLKLERNTPMLYFHAVSAYKLGKYKEAIRGFDQILKRNPANDYGLSSFILLALCQDKVGQWENGIRVLDAALRDLGEEPRIIKSLGYLILKHDPSAFRERMAKYLELPELKELNLYLAEHYLANGKLRPALDTLMEYSQQYPLTANLAKTIGDLHLKLKDHKNALSHYREAHDQTDVPLFRGRLLNNQSYCYWMTHQEPMGEQLLERAREISPNDPGLYYNLSLMLKEENYIRYRHMLDKAIELSDRTEDKGLKSLIYLEKGLQSLNEDNVRDAKKFLERALKTDPSNHVAQFNLKKLG